jgi:hypothetical protein
VADTGNANTEFAVAHGLGRVATDYLLTSIDKAGNVYTSAGGTAWTSQIAYLKCTAANASIRLRVF